MATEAQAAAQHALNDAQEALQEVELTAQALLTAPDETAREVASELHNNAIQALQVAQTTAQEAARLADNALTQTQVHVRLSYTYVRP